MEASSHGLAQHRLDGVRLAAAALTNITRDHMDYHSDHDEYVAAKLRLFHDVLPRGGTAVLNADDPIYPLARVLAPGRRVISVGRNKDADLRLLETSYRADGQDISFTWGGQSLEASLMSSSPATIRSSLCLARESSSSLNKRTTAISSLGGLKKFLLPLIMKLPAGKNKPVGAVFDT